MKNSYDIIFIGNYTKDTIITPENKLVVDGGAFNYGANVAARMGLKVAVVTRLAKEDFQVIKKLQELGVETLVKITPQSTCLRLEYPTSNLDQRTIYVTSFAGSFTPAEVKDIQAKAMVIGASMREEVSLEVVKELAKKQGILAADIQSFLRINDQGKLIPREWTEKLSILSLIKVLKTDAVEAEILTGTSNLQEAAQQIAKFGPEEVIITHRNGVLVYAKGTFYRENFFPHKIIGRSGRGDTCIAAYMAKRLNASPQESTLWAAAVTSLKLEVNGPFQHSIKEVNHLIQTKYQKVG
ncbi:MAG: PfkB family carbohydrate kinase [Candidatus Caldatribacteriota bacterium]